jgi:hypothetical protein
MMEWMLGLLNNNASNKLLKPFAIAHLDASPRCDLAPLSKTLDFTEM